MRFDITRVTATFGIFHPRKEKNKGMACDIPFRITIPAQHLAMLAPPQLAEGETDSPDVFVNELWTPEGYVRRPHLSPIKIHRKPEGVTVNIFDEKSTGKNGKPLTLNPCTLNKLEAELKSPHTIVLSGQIQYSQYNDKELTRINALSDNTFDLEISIPQNDMFEQNANDDDKKGGGKKDGDDADDDADDDDRGDDRDDQDDGSDPESDEDDEQTQH